MFNSWFVLVMIRRPPRATRTDTRFPYTTLFRSQGSPRICRTDGRAPRVNSYSASPLRLTQLVGGEKISGGSAAVSRNPSDVAEIVAEHPIGDADLLEDRKSTRLNSSH